MGIERSDDRESIQMDACLSIEYYFVVNFLIDFETVRYLIGTIVEAFGIPRKSSDIDALYGILYRSVAASVEVRKYDPSEN